MELDYYDRGGITGSCGHGGAVRPIYSINHSSHEVERPKRQDYRKSIKPNAANDTVAPFQRRGLARLWSMIWQPKLDPNLEQVKRAMSRISESL